MLIILSMVALRVIIEPSIMFFAAGRDGWLSYLFVLVVQVLGIFFISFIIKKNPQKSFVQVCEKTLGKVMCKIFLALLFIFFLFKIVGTDYEMQNFLLEAIYDELNWNVFIIPIFLVMLFVAIKGPKVMARLAEIFVPFALIVMIYTFVIALNGATFINVLPFGTKGLSGIMKGIYFGTSQMGEFLFLLMFMEYIDFSKEKIVKKFSITAVIISVTIVVFYFLFVAVFGDIAISLKEGIIRITQFYPNTDANLRIDGITTVLWLPISVLMSSIFYYCSAKCLMNLFNIKSFKISILVVFAVVIISKVMPFITSGLILNVSLNYFSFLSIAVQIFIPLILFISVLKKERKNEKSF